MTVVRMRGLKVYTHPTTGIKYCYHRATGTRILAPIGSPDFLREVAAAEALKGPKIEAVPGTLKAAIEEMRKSADWAALKPKTRFSYERAIEALNPVHDTPLVIFVKPFVVKLRDKIYSKRGRWMANYAAVAFLSIVFEFATARGWAKINPVRGVKKLKRDRNRPKANRPWRPDEARIVLNEASQGLRMAVAMILFVGLRKADLLAIEKTAIDEGKINLSTSKTDAPVFVPIHPDLRAIMRRDMRHAAPTICASSRGEPWTEDGLDTAFQRLVTRLENEGKVAPGLTLHGGRHTAGTRLREAGADLDTIRRILGQKTLAMAQRYSEDADLSDQMGPIVVRMNVLGKNRERRKSTPATA